MQLLRCTLVADGLSDRALVPILDWLIEQHTDCNYFTNFLERIPPPSEGLRQKVRRALAEYPCDILFVHRDAERDDFASRRLDEIHAAVKDVGASAIAVVPVRMTEAWLLADASAIRKAAGCPKGKVALHLPTKRLDRVADPKSELRQALRKASELPAKRLQSFNADALRFRVAELTESFAPLRRLPAFQSLERDLRATLERFGLARR